MTKKTMKDALAASQRAEPPTMAERVARLEAYFEAPAPPAREKVIRDGFTMPASDYALIAQVQATSLQARISVTKSEVLRAGLQVLSRLPLAELTQVLRELEKVKTGRAARK
jgi:hypothetical protein